MMNCCHLKGEKVQNSLFKYSRYDSQLASPIFKICYKIESFYWYVPYTAHCAVNG